MYKQTVPSHLLRHQVIPANLEDPVTVEDLITRVADLEGKVKKGNANLDAIALAINSETLP